MNHRWLLVGKNNTVKFSISVELLDDGAISSGSSYNGNEMIRIEGLSIEEIINHAHDLLRELQPYGTEHITMKDEALEVRWPGGVEAYSVNDLAQIDRTMADLASEIASLANQQKR